MLYVSFAFFLVYLANVALGAMNQARFMTDVQECLVLMVSIAFFVVSILRRQSEQNQKNT